MTGLCTLTTYLRIPSKLHSCLSAEMPIVDHVVEWLLDSGTSNTVMGERYVHDLETRVEMVDNPKVCSTANGKIVLDKRVRTFIPSIQEEVFGFVLKDTASAASLGRLCTEHGCSFHLGLL